MAVNDTTLTSEDIAIEIAVLGNDTDANGHILTVQSINASETIGTVEINPGDTTITYTPKTDFNGADTFKYITSDGNLGGYDTAKVIVTVTPVNDAPVAVNDNVSTAEDTPLTLAISEMLANDADIDGDTLTFESIDTTGTIGTVGIEPGNATVAYTPKADFNGEDIFYYIINDNKGGKDSAMVIVTVTPVNDRPVAVNDTVTTAEDNPITISVLSNDTDIDVDKLIVQSVDTVGTSGVVILNPDRATITYTPALNFNGSDSFRYAINDYHLGANDTATVFITVSPLNDSPIAMNDSVTTPEDNPISIAITDMLANDSDEEGDTLMFQSIDISSTSGSVVIDPGDTSITYMPKADFNGKDKFNYTMAKVELTLPW